MIRPQSRPALSPLLLYIPPIRGTIVILLLCAMSAFQYVTLSGQEPPVRASTSTQDPARPIQLTAKQKQLVASLKQKNAKIKADSKSGMLAIEFPNGSILQTPRDDGGIDKRKDIRWQNNAKILERLGELPIEKIVIHNTLFSATEFRSICRLTKLKSLAIVQIGDVEPEAFVDIGNLKNLKTLSISSSKINDELMLHLTDLKRLESLSLFSASLTVKSMKSIGSIKTLRHLDYSFAPYDQELLDEIFEMKQLQSLRIGGFHNPDDPRQILCADVYDLSRVSQLDKLTSLRLHSMKLTDKTYAAIGSMSGIRYFGIRSLQLTDDQFIACLPALRPKTNKSFVIDGMTGTMLTDRSVNGMIDDDEFNKNEFVLPVEFPIKVTREAAVRFKRVFPKAMIRNRSLVRDDAGFRIVTETIELPGSKTIKDSPRKRK